MRIRLMEMGFISGQDIEVGERKLGLHVVHMVSENGHIEQTFALRPEELGRICLNQK
jgi:Fe2+ transport system protein FeoA